MILLGLQTQAQTIADWFRGPTRKELSAENDRLRAGMDSLRFLVDSLERSRSEIEAEMLALLEGNSPEADADEQMPEYTPEQTDSLLHLWYRNSFSGDFDAMAEYETLDNLKVLCVQGSLSLPDLPKALDQKHRAIVDTAVVYKTEKLAVDGNSKDVADFKKYGADAAVFASPSAVESFVANAEKLLLEDGAVRPKIFSIGPTTTEALKKYGMQPYMEGGDIAGLLFAFLEAEG